MSKILSIDKNKNKGWFVGVHDDIKHKNRMVFIDFSKKKYKKYDVYEIKYDPNNKKYINDYILSFGASEYQHYYDKLRGYNELNHYDEKRKDRYYASHGYTDDIYSAKFYSNNLLW